MIREAFIGMPSLKEHARSRNRQRPTADVIARRRSITRRMTWRGMRNAAVSELRAVAYELTVVLPIAAIATAIWLACLIP